VSGFSVKPDVVESAGKDLFEMADAINWARLCVFAHVHIDGGGTFLNDIAGSVNEIRDQLESDYAVGGIARSTFDDAGKALMEISRDYRETDAAQAARYDSVLDIGAVQPPEYMGGKPGIDTADYLFVIDVPNGFASIDQLNSIAQGVDYVIGLDWMSGWLTTVGIVDPFAGFRARMEGDWRAIGKVVGALENLVEFWVKARADLESVPARFSGDWVVDPTGTGFDFYQRNDHHGGALNWSGEACDATVAWLAEVAEQVGKHGESIEYRAHEISLRVAAMYEGMTLVLETVEDLLELIPLGKSIEDVLLEMTLPWKHASRMVRLVGAAAKLSTRMQALFVIASELMGLFSGLLASVHSLEFPSVGYDAPSVNG
jgi:hypothetical protein